MEDMYLKGWNMSMTNKYTVLYSEVKHDFYKRNSNGAMGQWWYKEVALQAQCVFYSQCVRDSIKNVTWHFDDSQVLRVDPNARENCCLPCRSKSLSLCLSLSLSLDKLHPAFITQRFIMPKDQTHNCYTSSKKNIIPLLDTCCQSLWI